MRSCCQHGGLEARPALMCPACGEKGSPVTHTTLRSLLIPPRRTNVSAGSYRFCETPACEVVYYAEDGSHVFGKREVGVRVGVKETENPVPVCYCFGHTEQSILAEIEATGASTASARIRAEVKAARCFCETANPSGRCCLGAVSRVVARGLLLLEREAVKRSASAAAAVAHDWVEATPVRHERSVHLCEAPKELS